MPRLSEVFRLKPCLDRLCVVQRSGLRTKKINECYTPICDTMVVEPKKDSQELCKAGRFIVEQFFPHEPILKANSIKPNATLIQYYQEAANSGKLLYSVADSKDGKETLGMVIGHPLAKSDYKELISVADRIKHEPTRNYMTLIAEMEKKIDIMSQYNTKKAFSVDVLATTVDFRRRGVSKQLIEAILNAALKQEYDVIRLTTSSEFAAKAAAQSGFVAVYQSQPESLRSSKGTLLAPNPLCLPHKSMRIMVKDLRKKDKK